MCHSSGNGGLHPEVRRLSALLAEIRADAMLCHQMIRDPSGFTGECETVRFFHPFRNMPLKVIDLFMIGLRHPVRRIFISRSAGQMYVFLVR